MYSTNPSKPVLAFLGALWCSASLFVLPTPAASLRSTQPKWGFVTLTGEGT